MRLVLKMVAEYAHVPRRWREKGGENLEQGSLPPAVRPEEAEDLPPGNGEGDAGQGLPAPVPVAKARHLHGQILHRLAVAHGLHASRENLMESSTARRTQAEHPD